MAAKVVVNRARSLFPIKLKVVNRARRASLLTEMRLLAKNKMVRLLPARFW